VTDVSSRPGDPQTSRPKKQEQEHASEEITEVAPGILRMQLPIWMPGLGHVNMYGLMDDRGLAVVDPGLPGPESWKALKARLASAGYTTKDVHTVIVTHSHPDHFGAAGRLRKEADAQLIAHKAFTTWSLQRAARLRSWSTIATVRPRSRFRRQTRSSTSTWWARSRNVVGSSSSIIGVPWANVMAIHTRWR
jgi:mRNA degradation ribonuclease J1/J2